MENNKFDELLKNLSENEYVGLGNPYSKILFIGKEAGAEIGTEIYHGSVKAWKEKNNYAKRFLSESNLRNLNHTWQRNQKLYETIAEKLEIKLSEPKKDKYEITFVENIFTTELSCLPAKNTSEAKKQANFKDELKKRKEKFFKSDFIQNFPVILIFASDNNYIETYTGEICELFNVKYDGLFEYDVKDKIWLHSSKIQNEPKLLIHTRQLTNRISKKLIENLAEIIVNFAKDNEIKLIQNS